MENTKRFLVMLLVPLVLGMCLAPLTVLADEEPLHEEDSRPANVWDFIGTAKYLSMIGLMIVALVILLGQWVNLWVRLGGVIVAFVLFGLDFFFPLHPSPMCASTKLFMFKLTMGQWFPAFLSFFLVIFAPSLVVRKLFCGWICPLGALQELANKIPHRFHIKKINFTAFNSVRMTLLLLFFLNFYMIRSHIMGLGEALEADTAGRLWMIYSAYSIYEPINFFELMHWVVTPHFIGMMAILLIASAILYRPFCYSVCPIGALTWLLERMAPGRVRLDHDKCNDCGMCLEESPCPTIYGLKDGQNWSLPDCTSCGECVKTCPEAAIKFGFKK